MARGFSRWSHVFGFTLISFLTLLLGCFFILEKFPWQTIYADYGIARESKFLTPWPQSSMEEEQQDRRRLKRFAKPEVRRRFGIQLRRMDSLSSSLFDPFVDSGLTKQGLEKSFGPWPGPLFEVPFFSMSRNSNDAETIRTRYFAIPDSHGVEFVEGLSLEAGDDLRITIPLNLNRRSIEFTVYAQSPGSLRGYLGQFTWVRNFSEQDIHHKLRVSVPINDTGATSLRFTSQGASMILLNLGLGQSDKSGRNPIRLATDASDPWGKEDVKNPVSVESNREEIVGSTSLGKKGEDSLSEVDTSQVAGEEVLEDGDSSSKIASDQSGVLDKLTLKTPATAEVPVDPLEQTTNLVLPSEESTVALGYNLLLLQMGGIDQSLIADEAKLENLAPQFSELLRKSQIKKLFEVNQDALASLGNQPTDSLDSVQRNMFFKTIFPAFKPSSAHKHPHVLVDALRRSDWRSFPHFLRNFGYQIAYFAPSQFVTLERKVATGPQDYPEIERRWLSKEDGEFAKGNREIERLNTPATGLDAIFQSDNAPSIGGFTQEELLKVGEFSEFVASFEGKTPDLRAHQISSPYGGSLYLPSVVYSFQNWAKDSYQNRFFAHLVLEPMTGVTRASLKDLVKTIKTDGFKSIVSPSRAIQMSNQVALNRALEQILSTLKARKVTHRTVLLWFVPITKNGEFKYWMTGLSVPGLVPKETERSKSKAKVSFRDWTKGVLSLLGVPKQELEQVKMFAEDFRNTGPVKYKRMRLLLRGNERNSCTTLSWSGSAELLGATADVPLSFTKEKGVISGFVVDPCLWKGKIGRVEWYQRAEMEAKMSLESSEGTVLDSEYKPSQMFFGKQSVFQAVDKGTAEIFFGARLKDLKSEYLRHQMQGRRFFDPSYAAISDEPIGENSIEEFLKTRGLVVGEPKAPGNKIESVGMHVWLGAELISLDQ